MEPLHHPNPGLPEELWSLLDTRLWHATDRKGLFAIMNSGEIRHAMSERYREAFCRRQGAISLFDFGPTATNIAERFNEWSGWFGHYQDCHISAWLEVDKAACEGALLDAGQAREQWHTGPDGPQFIYGVEACHNGPIPVATINAVLLVARDDHARFLMCDHRVVNLAEAVDAFTRKLPPSPPDAVVEILKGGRARVTRHRRAGENDEPR